MDSGREIELKLSVRPDRLERVMRSPHLQGDGARRAIARALKNIYYDTPHLALRERGLVVRERGPKRPLQPARVGASGAGAEAGPCRDRRPDAPARAGRHGDAARAGLQL